MANERLTRLSLHQAPLSFITQLIFLITSPLIPPPSPETGIGLFQPVDPPAAGGLGLLGFSSAQVTLGRLDGLVAEDELDLL